MGRHILRNSIAAGAVLMLWGAPLPVDAQGQTVVIQGGTLIDGNGGAPVANSVVVIQGNRIMAVGQAGQVQVPAGAEIIDARGKWVLPGLWDNQVNYSWFYGPLALHQGVTSIVDIGNGEELSVAHRDAVNAGRVSGPRHWIGIGHLGGANLDYATGYETELSTRQIPRTVEETRTVARTLLDGGADMIMFHDGNNFTPEMVEAGCEEAHGRGKICTMRASGPQVGAIEAARAGVDTLPHARGIERAISVDGANVGGNVLENFALMDEAKAQEVIRILIEENVYPIPNLIHESPGYPAEWDRMDAAVREMFTDPDLLAFYPAHFYEEMRDERINVDRGETRARRMGGYQNVLRFYRMFDAAGGKTLIGGDTNAGKVAGMVVHDEMEIFQEAGIPNMHIIQGATSWSAESMNVLDDIGTIEAGKLADIMIVNADPLQNIVNLRNIDNVIFNGRVVDRDFKPYFSTPFLGSTDDIRAVEGLHWTEALKAVTFRVNVTAPPNPTESPQPAIQAIAPVWATEGDPGVTLRLTGFNFVRRSRVIFDGVSVPWTWVSPTELHVVLDANLLRRVGRFDIVVVNPHPLNLPDWGDGTSNKAHFIVNYRY